MTENSKTRIYPRDLITQMSVEELNRYSDIYYLKLDHPEVQMGKPFSVHNETATHLTRLGLMFENLNLGPGMRVLDFGSGTCWITKMLWQMGCSVTGIDVSEEALRLGRRQFEEFSGSRKPPGDWSLRLFDGHKLPLADGEVDRIICYDTFHHVPNQEVVVGEFERVLQDRGVIALNEPIGKHSASEGSQREMREHNVLENDLDLLELTDLFNEKGLRGPKLKIGAMPDLVLGIDDWKRIVKGRRTKILTKSLRVFARNSGIMYFYKGEDRLDSRHASGLAYSMQVTPKELQAKQDDSIELEARIENTGENIWLHNTDSGIGIVNIGIKLAEGEDGSVFSERDRISLDKDIKPGNVIEKRIPFQCDRKGRQTLLIDLVSEHVCWFAEGGSKPARITIDVA